MGSYIISRTESDKVELYLMQGKELGEVLELLKTEGRFAQFHAQVFEMKPDYYQHANGIGAVTLHQVGDNLQCSAAEHYLRVALHYARIDGSKDETDVLSQFARIILANLTDAKRRKEILNSAPVNSLTT